MNIFDNWLVQAIIGNVVCFILSKIATSFYTWIKTPTSKKVINSQKYTPSYPKKTLRKQFYICLVIMIICIPIFLSTTNQTLKALSLVLGPWSAFLMICSFECALESFEDIHDDRITNKS